MRDALKSPTAVQLRRAQREVVILRLLQDGPMTGSEIANDMNINPRTIKSIVYDLVQAGMVNRPRGSKTITLESP